VYVNSDCEKMHGDYRIKTKSMFKGRLLSKRRKERPRTRWVDNVLMGLRSWRGRVEDRGGWRTVVKEVKAHQELQICDDERNIDIM
jgi:hypothetical protein